jgi:hypothetical protein
MVAGDFGFRTASGAYLSLMQKQAQRLDEVVRTAWVSFVRGNQSLRDAVGIMTEQADVEPAERLSRGCRAPSGCAWHDNEYTVGERPVVLGLAQRASPVLKLELKRTDLDLWPLKRRSEDVSAATKVPDKFCVKHVEEVASKRAERDSGSGKKVVLAASGASFQRRQDTAARRLLKQCRRSRWYTRWP